MNRFDFLDQFSIDAENADCRFESDKLKCDCQHGFTGNGLFCRDINECFEGRIQNTYTYDVFIIKKKLDLFPISFGLNLTQSQVIFVPFPIFG